MVTLSLTAKAITTQRSVLTHAEFSTSSQSFVDVPNGNASFGVGMNGNAVFEIRVVNAGVFNKARIVNSDATTIGSEGSTNSTGYVKSNSGTCRNDKGASENFKIQIRTTGGFDAFIKVDTIILLGAPLTNLSDTFKKMSMNTIKMTSTNSDAIFGVPANQVYGDFIVVTIDAIVDQLIFSANSGKLIWDWDGNSIELIP